MPLFAQQTIYIYHVRTEMRLSLGRLCVCVCVCVCYTAPSQQGVFMFTQSNMRHPCSSMYLYRCDDSLSNSKDASLNKGLD